MSFRFALQNVLDIKLEELEALQNAERRVRADMQILEDKIEILRDGYFTDRENLNLKLRSSEFNDVKIFELSLEDKKRKIMDLLRGLNELRQALEALNKKTLELKKMTSGLEKLKERKKIAYEKKLESKLQLEIDNRSAVAVWNRNRSQRSL